MPVPSSKVNWSNFFDLGTATHSLTLTALKSDLENVSKSTASSNNGSTLTLEKSILSLAVKKPLLSPSDAAASVEVLFSDFAALLSEPNDFIVGNFFDC